MTFAIDMDGTLIKITPGYKPPYTFMPGAREAVRALKAAGHRIIIHSCRSNPGVGGRQRELAKWMVDFLDAEGVPYDEIWDKPGKPVADHYIDDRSIAYDVYGQTGMTWKWIADNYGEHGSG